MKQNKKTNLANLNKSADFEIKHVIHLKLNNTWHSKVNQERFRIHVGAECKRQDEKLANFFFFINRIWIDILEFSVKIDFKESKQT